MCLIGRPLWGSTIGPSGGGWSRMSKIPHDCKSVTNALSVGRMKPEKFQMEINGKVDERLLRVCYNCIPECALRICFILMHTFQDTCNTSVGSLFSSFPGLSQGLIRWTSGCVSLRFPLVWPAQTYLIIWQLGLRPGKCYVFYGMSVLPYGI